MTNWFKQHRTLCYGVSTAVFCGGLAIWMAACFYQPQPPAPARLNRFALPQSFTSYPASRYEGLMAGGLFFGSDQPEVQFHSDLVLLGLIKGRPSRALVGSSEADPQTGSTWIVKTGDLINGERIVAIEARYILVRNQSGQGKIYLTP